MLAKATGLDLDLLNEKCIAMTSKTSQPRRETSVNMHLMHKLLARQIKKLSQSEGFSLLEMVVVLAIIGILVAIQLPNVIGNTDKAKLIAAQTMISNAIAECATAKTNGAVERDLQYKSPKFADLVPSMLSNPSGFKWDSRPNAGCANMRLDPVYSDGTNASRQGFPRLMAKIAAGGRIIKVADQCKPRGTLDFTKECKAWDPTMSTTTYRTGRNLSDPNWPIKIPQPQPTP